MPLAPQHKGVCYELEGAHAQNLPIFRNLRYLQKSFSFTSYVYGYAKFWGYGGKLDLGRWNQGI